jgi:hypothetical protein
MQPVGDPPGPPDVMTWKHKDSGEEGRLLLPLTVHTDSGPHGIGVTVVAVRRGTRWPTRVVSSVAIFDCQGARDRRAEAQLRTLLEDSTTAEIAVLETRPHAKSKECLLHVEGFCLQR